MFLIHRSMEPVEWLKEKIKKDKDKHNLSAHKRCRSESRCGMKQWWRVEGAKLQCAFSLYECGFKFVVGIRVTTHFITKPSLYPGLKVWRKGCWTFCSAIALAWLRPSDLKHFLHLGVNKNQLQLYIRFLKNRKYIVSHWFQQSQKVLTLGLNVLSGSLFSLNCSSIWAVPQKLHHKFKNASWYLYPQLLSNHI